MELSRRGKRGIKMNYNKTHRCGECYWKCFTRCCFAAPTPIMEYDSSEDRYITEWARPIIESETPACHNFKENKDD